MSKEGRKCGYTPLGQQIRAMIAATRLNTNALAGLTGIPQPVLHRFMSGERANIRLDTADKLCRYFGVRLTPPQRATAGKAESTKGRDQ